MYTVCVLTGRGRVCHMSSSNTPASVVDAWPTGRATELIRRPGVSLYTYTEALLLYDRYATHTHTHTHTLTHAHTHCSL
jgi:hypothetical protein